MRTSGTVTTCFASTSSWISPRVSISASACRISSPTRSWRWDGPVLFSDLRLAMVVSDPLGLTPWRDSDAERRCHDPEGLTATTQSDRAMVSTLKHSMTSPSRMSW